VTKRDCKEYQDEVARWLERYVHIEQEIEKDPGGASVQRRINPLSPELGESLSAHSRTRARSWKNGA
jgi:hypothetical protein